MRINNLRNYIKEVIKRLSKIDMAVGVLISIYTAFFTFLTFSMYESFSYYGFDFAVFNQIMWNTLHDGFFRSTVVTGGNYFGQQMTPILILFLPIYAIFQSPKTLLFLQTAFLAFGALPLYLIVKKELDKRWGIIFSFIYLIHPTISYINLHEFHTNSFEIFFLLFSFYFFRKKKLYLFLIFALLSMFCKEDVAPIIIMFGIYAFILRYEKKFIFLPIIFGGAYLLLVFLLIMPMLGGKYIYFASQLYGRYDHLGKNFEEIIKNFLFHPSIFIKVAFTKDRIDYLAKMFQFSGFLPIFSPEVLLMTVPSFTENLLSSYPLQIRIEYHYTSSITPFLIVASAFSIKRLQDSLSNRKYYNYALSIFIFFTLLGAILFSILYSPLRTIPSKPNIFIIDEKDMERKRMLELIPKGASVMAHFVYLPHLSNREELYSFYYLNINNTLNLSGIDLEKGRVEYILLDFDDMYLNCCFNSHEGGMHQKVLLHDPSWGILALSHNIVLLKRNYKSPYTFIDVYKMVMSDDGVGKANFVAALWLKENAKKEDVVYATTAASYVQYVSEISERQVLNYTSDPAIVQELSRIELPENFGKDIFVETLKKYNVSYVYIFNKFGKSETVIWGTGKSTTISKPDIITSHPEVFELVYENEFVRIYKARYLKAFNPYSN